MGREVVDGGVLVEVVGRVGFAFGGRAVSDVVVIVGDLIRGGQFIASVVAVLLVILGGAAAEEIIGVDVRGIGGVGDGGEEVAVGFVRPCDDGVIRIGQLRLEICAQQIVPLKVVRFSDTASGGEIDDGQFTSVIHIITRINCQNVPILEELAPKTLR